MGSWWRERGSEELRAVPAKMRRKESCEAPPGRVGEKKEERNEGRKKIKEERKIKVVQIPLEISLKSTMAPSA